MIEIDALEIISRECPKYPEPRGYYKNPEYRLKSLNAFQSDAAESVTWLVIDSLKAALDYIEWLEVNITAADNEIYGIYSSSEGKPDTYEINSFLEARKGIRDVIGRLRKCQTSNQ